MTTEKRTYKTSFIERFKDKRRRSLPFRLTSTLILTLLSIYIIIILSTYLVTSITTKKSTKQEVTLIAQKNANQIENILSRGDILVKSLGKYVENNINIDKKALENYIKFNIKDVVDNQSEFFALGITFEPYLFDTAKKDLSIYGYRDGNNITFSDLGSYDTYSKKEYYSLAKQRKKTVCSEPYIGKLPTNEEVWMITLSSPIYVNNKFLGTVLIDVDIRSFKKIKTDNLTYKTLSSFILTDKSTFVYHGLNSKLPGKNLKDIESKADLSLINTNIKNGVQFSVDDLSISTKKSTTNFYVPIKAGSSGNNWSSVVTIEKFDMNKSALLIGLILVTICILGLVIIIFIANRLINNSLSPINTMVNAANNISNGNLKIDIEVTTEDEMGALALAFSNTSNTLQSYISEISYILKNIADGNLNIEVKNDYNGDFQGIKTSMLDISNSLNYIIGNISQSSVQVASSADQMAKSSQDIANGASEQACTIEEFISSTQNISHHTNHSSEKTQEALDFSIKSKNEAVNGNSHMDNMLIAMNEINKASNNIEQIVNVIESISSQTNLLSLNASIEAARAGESGRGFAVVADEVRILALRSSDAVREITSLIENSKSKVIQGTSIANLTSNSFKEIVSSSEKMTEVLKNIFEISTEQSTSIRELSLGIQQISNVVETNASGAEENSAISQELSAQATTLNHLIENFKLKE